MVIKIRENVARIKLKAAALALTIGIILFVIKMTAYLLTESTAVLSDALESTVNILASGFVLISLLIAKKPADPEHPYGHGKIEFLAAGFEGAGIIVAAVLIIYHAVFELVAPHPIERLNMGLVLVGFAAAVNALLGFYLIKKGKQTQSISLEADGRHVLTDVVTSVGVLVGIGLILLTGYTILDPITALIVAVCIIWTGSNLVRRSLGGMMDRADRDDLAVVKEILDSNDFKKRICGYHKIRTRKSGGVTYVDFHLLMPREMNLHDAHEIATEIEDMIVDRLGDSGVMAHIEPCRDIHCETCQIERCDKKIHQANSTDSSV